MIESFPTLENPSPNAHLDEEAKLVALVKRREEFVDALLESHLIAGDTAYSGVLDLFIIDGATGHDSLIHILAGDSQGGAHHLPTAQAMNEHYDHVVIAATRLSGSKSLSGPRLRQRQSVRSNGTFQPKCLTINEREKMYGSAMFPNSWSADTIIHSILGVAESPPESYDTERMTYIHRGEVDGVTIRVVTSEKTGKIITAFPEVPKE